MALIVLLRTLRPEFFPTTLHCFGLVFCLASEKCSFIGVRQNTGRMRRFYGSPWRRFVMDVSDGRSPRSNTDDGSFCRVARMSSVETACSQMPGAGVSS